MLQIAMLQNTRDPTHFRTSRFGQYEFHLTRRYAGHGVVRQREFNCQNFREVQSRQHLGTADREEEQRLKTNHP